MNDLRKAAEDALEALEYYRSGEDYQPTPASKAIFSLCAALAQPEQEPVAWKVWDRMGGGVSYRRNKPHPSEYVEYDALYAHPPQRKPLRTVIYACPICAASLERQE